MKINLVAVGTKMPAWVTQGFDEYSKRLPRECQLQLVEIPAAKRGKTAQPEHCLLYTSPSPRDRG